MRGSATDETGVSCGCIVLGSCCGNPDSASGNIAGADVTGVGTGAGNGDGSITAGLGSTATGAGEG